MVILGFIQLLIDTDMVYCTVLYTELYCTVNSFDILYGTVLYCTYYIIMVLYIVHITNYYTIELTELFTIYNTHLLYRNHTFVRRHTFVQQTVLLVIILHKAKTIEKWFALHTCWY